MTKRHQVEKAIRSIRCLIRMANPSYICRDFSYYGYISLNILDFSYVCVCCRLVNITAPVRPEEYQLYSDMYDLMTCPLFSVINDIYMLIN